MTISVTNGGNAWPSHDARIGDNGEIGTLPYHTHPQFGAHDGALSEGQMDIIGQRYTMSPVLSTQERIAKIASSYEGSTDWAKNSGKIPEGGTAMEGAGAPGVYKCSLFVHDVLNQAGNHLPMVDQGLSADICIWVLEPVCGNKDSVYNARQWANGEVPGFTKVAPPKAGDVAAFAKNYSDATGHAGIVGYNDKGVLGVFSAGNNEVSWSSFKDFFDSNPHTFLRTKTP